MGGMRRCRRPLAFMAYGTTDLIKSVWFDIPTMEFIGLWGIRHFGILDPKVACRAAISDPKLRIPNLLHLQWLGQDLLLETRISLEVSLCDLRRP